MSTSHTMMTSPREIAADIARELREHPERWCKGQLARDDKGNPTGAQLPDAAQWCLEGHCSARTDSFRAYHDAIQAIRTTLGVHELFRWNDAPERTVEDVIAACERVANRPDETRGTP